MKDEWGSHRSMYRCLTAHVSARVVRGFICSEQHWIVLPWVSHDGLGLRSAPLVIANQLKKIDLALKKIRIHAWSMHVHG